MRGVREDGLGGAGAGAGAVPHWGRQGAGGSAEGAPPKEASGGTR